MVDEERGVVLVLYNYNKQITRVLITCLLWFCRRIENLVMTHSKGFHWWVFDPRVFAPKASRNQVEICSIMEWRGLLKLTETAVTPFADSSACTANTFIAHRYPTSLLHLSIFHSSQPSQCIRVSSPKNNSTPPWATSPSNQAKRSKTVHGQ